MSTMAEVVEEALRVLSEVRSISREDLAEHVAEELGKAGYGLMEPAWDRGYQDSNEEWNQCWDLVTPDEDRFVARNPYRPEAVP